MYNLVIDAETNMKKRIKVTPKQLENYLRWHANFDFNLGSVARQCLIKKIIEKTNPELLGTFPVIVQPPKGDFYTSTNELYQVVSLFSMKEVELLKLLVGDG